MNTSTKTRNQLAQAQAELTRQVRLIEFISQNPGISGSDDRIPQAYRRFFHQLESLGKIQYHNGWYVR